MRLDAGTLGLLHTFGEVRRAAHRSAAHREEVRRRRLADIVAWSRRHSPVYAELYEGLPERVENPSRLPVASKAYLMERFERWVTDPAITRDDVDAFLARQENLGRPFGPARLVACLTSGSSGAQGVFLHDRRAMEVYGALWLARAHIPWLGLVGLLRASIGRNWVSVMADSEHYMGAVMTRWAMESVGRGGRSTLVPALQPRADLARQIERLRPVVLSSYPSAIEALVMDEEIRPRIRPRLIIASTETLTEPIREKIAAAFGCSVRSSYAASEFPAIGFDCDRGWLHLNDDFVILEPVDGDGAPVAPGNLSDTVLVTNLVNRIQPVLRYDLGDRVVVRPDPCPCGSRLPAIRVVGRRQELLTFRSADGSLVGISGNSFLEIVERVPGVLTFQVIRSDPRRLRVRFRTGDARRDEEAWGTIRERLEAFFEREGLPGIEVERDPTPPRAARSGKFPAAWAEP